MRQSRSGFDEATGKTTRYYFDCSRCGFRSRPMSATEWLDRLDAAERAGVKRVLPD